MTVWLATPITDGPRAITDLPRFERTAPMFLGTGVRAGSPGSPVGDSRSGRVWHALDRAYHVVEIDEIRPILAG